MGNNVLVNLDIPAIRENYDLLIPDDVDILSLTQMLANGIRDISSGRYGLSGKEMLMHRTPDMLFDPARTLWEYGIKDGATLVLL